MPPTANRGQQVLLPGKVDRGLHISDPSAASHQRRVPVDVAIPDPPGGLVTGIALSFAHTMGEFGVVLMVGGNIPGVTRTVSIDIYDKVQAFDYAGANATALMLLAISFTILSLVYALNRKLWAVWPFK